MTTKSVVNLYPQEKLFALCLQKFTIVSFTTRGHLFFKISRFILGVEQPYFACPFKSICPNWGFNLGFCSSAVKKFFKKSLLKICSFCERDF